MYMNNNIHRRLQPFLTPLLTSFPLETSDSTLIAIKLRLYVSYSAVISWVDMTFHNNSNQLVSIDFIKRFRVVYEGQTSFNIEFFMFFITSLGDKYLSQEDLPLWNQSASYHSAITVNIWDLIAK
jgi:hypothetical protein